MLISVVIDTDITAGHSADVDIGVSLPLEGVKGIVSVQDQDATAGAYLPPGDYTATVKDDDTVTIAVTSEGTPTALASGDIVNIAVICRGEIARP